MSTATALEAAKAARLAVLQGLSTGRRVVEYRAGSKMVRVDATDKALAELNATIKTLKGELSAETGTMKRLAAFRRRRATK